MLKSTATKFLSVLALAAAVTALLPTAALAREGAGSVGKGIKCYTAAVLQADGTVKYTQVCYKAI